MKDTTYNELEGKIIQILHDCSMEINFSEATIYGVLEQNFEKAAYKIRRSNFCYDDEVSVLKGKLQTALNTIKAIESQDIEYINNIRPFLKAAINTIEK